METSIHHKEDQQSSNTSDPISKRSSGNINSMDTQNRPRNPNYPFLSQLIWCVLVGGGGCDESKVCFPQLPQIQEIPLPQPSGKLWQPGSRHTPPRRNLRLRPNARGLGSSAVSQCPAFHGRLTILFGKASCGLCAPSSLSNPESHPQHPQHPRHPLPRSLGRRAR